MGTRRSWPQASWGSYATVAKRCPPPIRATKVQQRRCFGSLIRPRRPARRNQKKQNARRLPEKRPQRRSELDRVVDDQCSSARDRWRLVEAVTGTTSLDDLSNRIA